MILIVGLLNEVIALDQCILEKPFHNCHGTKEFGEDLNAIYTGHFVDDKTPTS